MNKMNVDIDRLLADNTRLSKENKKLNQDLMKELHYYKAKHTVSIALCCPCLIVDDGN